VRRRDLLIAAGRCALAASAVPVLARAQPRAVSAEWTGLLAELEKQTLALMAANAMPGVSIALVKDGQLFWRRGWGVKNSKTREPVTDTTVFEAQSMSKPVFAYAVMKLVDKGVLDLDTPLTKYTSERFLEGDPRLDLITARHVLSHTTGFQNWRSDSEPLAIQFTPGTKFQYSGEGYSYLLSVIARLTGQPIEDYMREHVFAPFGMTSSGYLWRDLYEREAASPHDEAGEPLPKGKPDEASVARYASAGALHTTPTDYAKFLIEVVDPKPADEFRLSGGALAEMVRPQVDMHDQFGRWWALGWTIVRRGDRGDLISHGGDIRGFHSYCVASTDHKAAWVAMTNGDNAQPVLLPLLRSEILGRLLDE